ncbi:MAG: hypothetical protein M4579_003704 [Chaenotheca gracillima]|nr:MAG: hypothetical protein M4579_003704 [Chaenotheca gracillima]
MPIEIQEAVDADIYRIMEFQYDAFIDPHEPFYDVLFPGGKTPAALTDHTERTLKWWHEDPSATFLKAVDTETGEIVGAAKWLVVPTYDAAAEAKKPHEPMKADWLQDEDDRAFAEYIMDQIHTKRGRRITGPHCLLDILFTDPKHHRRGAGTKLVQWGTSRADEMGVEAFVESTPYGKHLYEQNGFVANEHAYFRPERWSSRPVIHVEYMHRPAKNGIVNPAAVGNFPENS